MFRRFSHGEMCAALYWKVYTRNGLDDALVETQVFGKKIIEQVLSGTHYTRSLRAILILVDFINRLKWDAFWENNRKEKYKETLPLFRNILF